MIPHACVFKYSACAIKNFDLSLAARRDGGRGEYRIVGRDRRSMSKGEATSGLL